MYVYEWNIGMHVCIMYVYMCAKLGMFMQYI